MMKAFCVKEVLYGTKTLQKFCEKTIKRQSFTEKDALYLLRSLLSEGLFCREEADILIALDRALNCHNMILSDTITGFVVNYVVWGERPTGRIDTDKARWLAASLSAGRILGPSAIRIAREAIREAQETDEPLLRFVMQAEACQAKGCGLWGESARF
jgi:hypothetical protein